MHRAGIPLHPTALPSVASIGNLPAHPSRLRALQGKDGRYQSRLVRSSLTGTACGTSDTSRLHARLPDARRLALLHRDPAIRVTPRTRSANCAHYASNEKRSAIRIPHYFLWRPRTLQNTANIFKNISPIRFNLVSYNQKKFDTSLSFLIPSDGSNLTNCSRRNRFRSTFFRFRRTAVLAAGRIIRAPTHAISRCISLDNCHPAAGRRIESNEQDNETVALAISPASRPAQLRRIAAQPSRYRVFRISPRRKDTFPDRAKGPVASVPSARVRQKSAVHDPHRCRPLLFVLFDVQPEG